jgi:hypothetical protein
MQDAQISQSKTYLAKYINGMKISQKKTCMFQHCQLNKNLTNRKRKAKFTAYCTYVLWFYRMNKQIENTTLHIFYIDTMYRKGSQSPPRAVEMMVMMKTVHEWPADSRLNPKNRSMLTCL